ncbi:MAG: hypothetical protein ABI566_07395 [Pseudolysinimonas sp.]
MLTARANGPDPFASSNSGAHMSRRRLVLAALSAAVLVTCGSVASATAATTDPRVHVLAEAVVQDNEFAVFSVEYRCPPGATGTLAAELRQGGTPDDPASLYVRGPERSPVLTCDGSTRTAPLGMLLVDYDEAGAGVGDYAFVCDTAICDLKAEVTATLTLASGAVDVDVRRLKVVSR